MTLRGHTLPDKADSVSLDDGGTGATAYADAVATYLAFAVDKAADYWSGICSWHSSGEKMRNTFGRQAIPMVWDYAECCPFRICSKISCPFQISENMQKTLGKLTLCLTKRTTYF
jgi:adenine-specific DNA methylase